ncbi:ATP-dependent DNA helicase pfh1-like [Chenopodium quinoa]|uniref:ATP-dependent DNA helicase pfh1-like n=1 Tax=Chenopodium quinoa TaxID=63459 RepID=UPI000B7814CA|nr:ATP-dependent DNA helicase pfh1-like [Chenopodium quinoa]
MAGEIVLPTATSGIAVANIPSGRTVHSRFKIPLNSETSFACDVPKQGSLAALIKQTALIIWDEASMAKKENIKSVELLLLFGGDFRQVLSVVPRKTQREAIATSLLQCTGNDFVQVPAHIVSYYQEGDDPINYLATTTFPELEHATLSQDIFIERAILTPLNDVVDSINTFLINKFLGNSVAYKSFDSMLDDNCAIYPTEFLNQLAPGGMTPHELVLKINSHVILLRNIDPANSLCNRTRLICKSFRRNVIVCSIATGHRQGELMFVHRVNLRPPSSAKYPIQFEQIQFLLKLSFAMTINKSQGQTLSRVIVYLPQPCFSHGQLYVTLSRAKQSTKVTVITPQPADHHTSEVLKNVVAYDVLQLSGII